MAKSNPKLEVGRFIELAHPQRGIRVAKILKIDGRKLTVVLAPYRIRGRFKGQKIRIPIDWVTGIIFRKKMVGYDAPAPARRKA